jgi:flagellar L-ring protein precursor FlgH
MHQETLTVVVTGQVRPQDVGADNLVRSSAIADAEIRIEGKGTISQRQQPGVFQRLFDWLGWF